MPGASPNDRRSADQRTAIEQTAERTLVPMLIWGLILILVGMSAVVYFA